MFCQLLAELARAQALAAQWLGWCGGDPPDPHEHHDLHQFSGACAFPDQVGTILGTLP